MNPPIGLQSIMGINHAKISWNPPHLLGHQGNGAWQQWQYHLQITNVNDNITEHKLVMYCTIILNTKSVY